MGGDDAEKRKGESALDTILDAEQRLDARMVRYREEADERIRLARVSAQARQAQEEKRIFDNGVHWLEEQKRIVDERLVREGDERERQINRVASALEQLRQELCRRIVAKVLGT